MTKREMVKKSVEYKHSGCNCCQAVVRALTEGMELDEEMLVNIGSAFGSGMGCMKGNCGALVGANIAAGLMGKGKCAKKIYQRFEKLTGATICGEIKGKTGGEVLSSCDNCVKNAVRAAYDILELKESRQDTENC